MSISAATLAAAKSHADQAIHKAELDDIQLDKTLAKSNYAADAKTVGDALNNRVRFDEYQYFSDDFKSKARSNIGAAAIGNYNSPSFSEALSTQEASEIIPEMEISSVAKAILGASHCTKTSKDGTRVILDGGDGIFFGLVQISKTIPPCLLSGGELAVKILLRTGGSDEEEYGTLSLALLSGEDEDEVESKSVLGFVDSIGFSNGMLYAFTRDEVVSGVFFESGIYGIVIELYNIPMIEYSIAPSMGGWGEEDEGLFVAKTYNREIQEKIYKASLTNPVVLESLSLEDSVVFKATKLCSQTPSLAELNEGFGIITSQGEEINEWSQVAPQVAFCRDGMALVVYEPFDFSEWGLSFFSPGIYLCEVIYLDDYGVTIKESAVALYKPVSYQLFEEYTQEEIKEEALPSYLRFGKENTTYGSAHGNGEYLSWDGNTAGLSVGGAEISRKGDSVAYWVKVSDILPPRECLDQGVIAIRHNYETQIIPLIDDDFSEEEIYGNEYAFVVYGNNPYGFEPGIYFIKLETTFFELITKQLYLPGVDFSPKPGKIDPKYLPFNPFAEVIDLGVAVPMGDPEPLSAEVGAKLEAVGLMPCIIKCRNYLDDRDLCSMWRAERYEGNLDMGLPDAILDYDIVYWQDNSVHVYRQNGTWYLSQ